MSACMHGLTINYLSLSLHMCVCVGGGGDGGRGVSFPNTAQSGGFRQLF